MNKLLTAAIVMLFACCKISPSSEYGSLVKKIANPTNIHVSYEPFHFAFQMKMDDCEKKLLDSNSCKEALKSVPIGGYLHLKIKTSNSEISGFRNWTFIIRDTMSKEIIRMKGNSYFGSPYGNPPVYHSSEILRVDSALPKVFRLYVLNEIENGRSEFLIHH